MWFENQVQSPWLIVNGVMAVGGRVKGSHTSVKGRGIH